MFYSIRSDNSMSAATASNTAIALLLIFKDVVHTMSTDSSNERVNHNVTIRLTSIVSVEIIVSKSKHSLVDYRAGG